MVNKFFEQLKVDNKGDLISLKYQVSNHKIRINDLKDSEVKGLIELYKNSNQQLKRKMSC